MNAHEEQTGCPVLDDHYGSESATGPNQHRLAPFGIAEGQSYSSVVSSSASVHQDQPRQADDDMFVKQHLDRVLHRSGFRLADVHGITLRPNHLEVAAQDAKLRLEPIRTSPGGFWKCEITFASPELRDVLFEVGYG